MRSITLEAKLKSADRKKLDSDNFGLPDERKYPLNDEEHVRKAIQFFKFCPVDKRPILAKNINMKIKEYDMSIEVSEDNPFYIYANRLTVKVKEAFMPDNDSINKDEKNVIRNYKIFKESDMVNLELLCFSIINEFFEDRMVNGSCKKDGLIMNINEEMNIKYSEFIEFLNFCNSSNNMMSITRIDSTIGYTFCESAATSIVSLIKDNKHIGNYLNIIETHSNVLHAYRCICDIIMSVNMTMDIEDWCVLSKLNMLTLCKDRLYDIINKTTNFNIMNSVDIYDDKYKCLLCYGNELRKYHNQIKNNIYIINTDNTSLFTSFNSYNKLYSDILSYSFDPSIFCPKYLTTKLDIRDLMILNNTFNNIKIVQNMDAAGDYMYFGIKEDDTDTALLFFKHNQNDIYYSAVIKNNAEMLLSLSVEGYGKPYISIQPINVKKIMVGTTESLKSVNINKDGDIKIEIAPNKSYMDSYSENHKLLVENYKNKNYDAMKENLSFVFALISIIERSDEYKRRDPDVVKARAFAMNDFKTYLSHVHKVEPKFDFARYYIDSDYDKKIINVPKTTIIGVKNLIKALIV